MGSTSPTSLSTGDFSSASAISSPALETPTADFAIKSLKQSSRSFGSKTRALFDSLTTPTSSDMSNNSISFRSRSYYNLDDRQNRMPDLLVDQSQLDNKRCWIGEQDPIHIEKSNLVNILKLVIKEVIDSSLSFGRQLDSDHIPLQHFFIVLEHILRHGIRPKKGLLGSKKELWDLLQLVEKHEVEAVDITTSVRDLPTVKTPLGRSRAWLRLAVMQKKLADYFQYISGLGGDILGEFYEPRALLRSDEAAIVTGLLLSLNVVDCNLCVKEEDLECQQGVIDFSLYLRNNKSDAVPNEDTSGGSSGAAANLSQDDASNISAILDQKSYVEELNRHLNATVTNMHAKIEGISTTNALMKEDMSECKKALFRCQEENRLLLAQLERNGANSDSNRLSPSTSVSSSSSSFATSELHSKSSDKKTSIGNDSGQAEVNDLKRKCSQEMKRVEHLEKELELQKSMRSEMEVAMKLLEKDVHEKQDTIVSLRDQLDDIKNINLEMYNKLQGHEKSIRHKNDLISRLEIKSMAMADTLEKLDEKFLKCDVERKTALNTMSSMGEALAEHEKRSSQLEADLKIEREFRLQLEAASQADKEIIEKNRFQLKQLLGDEESLKVENQMLKAKVAEAEKCMEELAGHISSSKLKIDFLLEEQANAEDLANFLASHKTWLNDSQVKDCPSCNKEFVMARRKHHCRHCGGIFCDPCSANRLALASSSKPVRVCDKCYTLLVGRFSTT